MKARSRIGVAVTLLVLVPLAIMAAYDIRREMVELSQFRTQTLEGLSSLMARSFPEDYKPLPAGETTAGKSREERIRALGKVLQPLAERLVEAYPGVTVLVHVRDVDAVVAQGSPDGRLGMVGKGLTPDSPGWEVYRSGQLVKKVHPMPPGRMLTVFRPIYSGTRIVAYASASYPQSRLVAEVKEAVLSKIAFSLLALVMGVFSSGLMLFILKTDLERVKGSLKEKDTSGVKGHFFLREFRELMESAHPLVQDREFILRIFDHLRPGVVACDLDFHVTFVNDSFLKLLGFTRKELLGKPLGILAEREESGAPRFTKVREVRDSGKPSDYYRRRMMHKSGRLVPVEILTCPIYGKDGEVSGLVSLVYDLSPDIAVHRLEQTSNFVLESIKSGVFAIDQECRVTMFNRVAEEVTGFRREEVTGRHIDEVFPGREPFYRLARNCLEKGDEVRNLVQSWRLNEREVRLLTDSSLLRDPDGNPIGAVVVFRDVTELLRLRERVARAEKLAAVGQLAAGAAHEIRNPLTSVRGFVQMLNSRFQSSGRQDEERLSGVILAEIDRIASLLRDFLQLAKPPERTISSIDIRKVINSTIHLIQNDARAIPVEIRKELAGDLPDIPVDRERIRQVLLNLFRNALQAMEGGGVLAVRAALADDGASVLMEVEDNGPGIASENLRRVFDPFFTTKADGTGLGLAICQRIVADHGGDIQVWSEPGRGTRVRVYLPRGREPGRDGAGN